MERLTIIAAFVGGLPIFAFLVVVWLTEGAPLTPIGALPANATTPILSAPVGAPAADTAAVSRGPVVSDRQP